MLSGLNIHLDVEDRPTCRVADGKQCTSLGSILVPVKLAGKIKLTSFIVVPDIPYEMILGVDFCRNMELLLDLANGRWDFSGAPTFTETAAVIAESSLTADQKKLLDQMLQRNWKRMRKTLGCTSLVAHKISTNSEPVKQRYYPVSPAMQKCINEELEQMLRDDIVEPSSSPWSSPILMVPRKDGGYRFCIDFRRLNKVTQKDAYPIPYVSAILTRLRGARYLSSMDIKSAYWQIPMSEESKEFTAFTVPGKGLYQFKRMPFGLTNAPATWQRLIDRVLGADLEPHVFVYLDDIIVVAEDFQQHLDILQKIFERLYAAGLTLSPEKCQFCRPELRYLGYIVDSHGLRVDPDKVKAIMNIPHPSSVSDVRSFLGMASWYRKFVPNFADITTPLTELLKKSRKWFWSEECQSAFNTLKERLVSAPILTCPNFQHPFTVQTDASAFGLGAVLSQDSPEGEKVICYLSRSLSKAERNYSTTERECLAVVWALDKLRPYIEGSHFTVITDHHSLIWLARLKDPSGRLCRWAVKLQQYDFTIVHRKGKDHAVPDCLSRTVTATDCINVEPAPPEDKWYRTLLQRVQAKPEKYPAWRVAHNILYKYVQPKIPELADDTDGWREVVPKGLRRQIISRIHTAPTTGHAGVFKTHKKLQTQFYWPKMHSDVVAYVRHCAVCAMHKVEQKRPPGYMGSRPKVSKPFQLVSTDLIGPLPRSTRGYRYILVVADYYSKFVLTFPLRNATAQGVTTHIKNDLFLLFGVPQYIICDNGVQYRSKEFKKLCQEYDVQILYNALYHPQNNPAERVNRVIKTMLASYVKDNHRDWDKYLPSVTCAIRTLTHEVTGYTPYFINFGREHIISGKAYSHPNIAPDGQIIFDRAKIQHRLQGYAQLHQDIGKRLSKAYEKSRNHYNLRRRQVEYEVGQLVWRRNFVLSNAADYFAQKLASKYVGPYRVRKKVSGLTYQLEDDDNIDKGIWHVKDLKAGPEYLDEDERVDE